MARSRPETFDHMVHTANAWLADIAEAFGTKDRRFAYRVLRAWLHALRDRLTVEGAAQFAAQLPELVRGVYSDGWNPSMVPVRYGPEEFVERFAREANIPAGDVRWTAARISVAMQAHFSPGQLDRAVAQLPDWLRDTGAPPTDYFWVAGSAGSRRFTVVAEATVPMQSARTPSPDCRRGHPRGGPDRRAGTAGSHCAVAGPADAQGLPPLSPRSAWSPSAP